ncbi:polysaccharide biosynthesis tyrosine autokinase [soil metagenome]
MSAPVLDTARTPIDLPVADGVTGINFISIARRRWPWVLVGLLVGIVGGLLAYSSRPSIYQSNAQLLVIKKREGLSSDGGRMAYMEDYMSTQSAILKSESVMMAAARRVDPAQLRSGYPSELQERSKLITAQFAAVREKDANNPMSMNNALNVSVKGANADDCTAILKIVIDAYRDELRGVYEEVTVEKMSLLRTAIDRNTKKIEANVQEMQTSADRIRSVTLESPEVIQARFSKMIDAKQSLSLEDTEIRESLALIRNAGDDRTKRGVVLQQLGNFGGRSMMPTGSKGVDNSDPNQQRYELEAQKTELLKRYGKDHPVIEQIDARMKYLKELNMRLNPSDPEGKMDGLAQMEMFLERRQKVVTENLAKIDAAITSDNKVLSIVIPEKQKIETMSKMIEGRQKLNETYEADYTTTELTRISGGFQVKVLNEPSREPTPVAPKLSQSLLLGAAAGLLFGIGLAALAELSDKGFRSPADIRNRLGLPVIGHIPPIRTNLPADEDQAGIDLEPTMVTALRPKSVEAEAYRGVRTALYFNAAGSTHQMIQVTSPNQGDGKSTLAANLAVSIAQSGKRCLLVDCDMRRPRVHRVFHLADPGPGLAAVIMGGVPLSAAIQRSCVENLFLLPCGKKPQNPAELLTSPNFGDLLDRLKADFDYVILDTPPVLAVSDPSAVAPRADGVILVFRMSNKVRPAAERAREQLAQIGANIIGVVVNGSGRSNDGNYGGYGGGYGSEYTGYTNAGQYQDNYADGDDENPPKKG